MNFFENITKQKLQGAAIYEYAVYSADFQVDYVS